MSLVAEAVREGGGMKTKVCFDPFVDVGCVFKGIMYV